MHIKYLGGDKFEIKSKDVNIELGNIVKVNSFEFPGPGEYEKSGIFIEGIADKENTINLIRVEEVNLCHLGKLTHDLSENEAKEIGSVDILFVPLGEDGTTPTKKALSVISRLDPKVVIPMLYTDLTEFKKSEGISDGEMDVLKIRKADLPENERMNVILKS